MKPLLFTLAVFAVTAGLGSRAQAQNYPWCALYDTADEARNCGFVSYEQCKTTVSGIGGWCMLNNLYQPPKPPKRH